MILEDESVSGQSRVYYRLRIEVLPLVVSCRERLRCRTKIEGRAVVRNNGLCLSLQALCPVTRFFISNKSQSLRSQCQQSKQCVTLDKGICLEDHCLFAYRYRDLASSLSSIPIHTHRTTQTYEQIKEHTSTMYVNLHSIVKISANNQGNGHNGAGPQQQEQLVIQQTGIKWSMTAKDGSVYQQDEDLLYEQVTTAARGGNQGKPVYIGDYIPLFRGTPEERGAIGDAILARLARDPTFTGGAWKGPSSQHNTWYTTYYTVRGKNGTFHKRTMEQIIGSLIQGETTPLELQGTASEQRKFFAAVRQYISTMTVVQGKNVKEHGAVIFLEPEVRRALATVDEMEAMFESMLLDDMQPVAEEPSLASALHGMEMDSMQPAAEEANLASALDGINMDSMQPAAEETELSNKLGSIRMN